ncbi:hypothetical protein M0804_006573 [Polistes exclamans]|nr:hypothetical protein M0804_006573 [Polistes exclamans]
MDVGDISSSIGLPPGSGSNPGNTSVGVIANTTSSSHTVGWWTPTSSIASAPATTDVMNQLCRVCGEPAAGFHFGAFTCEGCKSFFGRTYNNLGSISECKNGGICVINKKNRTACKACRLRKCLMVGMSKSGSRYGRRSNWFKIHCLLQEQTHQAHTRLIKDPKSSQEQIGMRVAELARAPQELLRPEVSRSAFPMWRGPAFLHPALTQMQFLNTPFFPFQQRFIVPYVNQIGAPPMLESLSSSSSESISPRSTPSPTRTRVEDDSRVLRVRSSLCEEVDRSSSRPKSADESVIYDKSLAFFRSLGPEQEEPIDLSIKAAVAAAEAIAAATATGTTAKLETRETDPGSTEEERSTDNEDNELLHDTVPPLDLTRKT